MAEDPQNKLDQNPEDKIETLAKSEPKKSKIGIIIGLIIFFLVILLGLGYYYLYIYAPKTSSKSVNQSTQTDKTQPQVVSQKPESVDPLMAKFTNPVSGEKWYTQPKKLGDLGYLIEPDNKQSDSSTTATYYEIGTHSGNIIILGQTESSEQIEPNLMRPEAVIVYFEKSSKGDATALLNANSTMKDNPHAKDYLSKTIAVNTTTTYDSLNISDTTFHIGGNEKALGTNNSQININKDDSVPSAGTESTIKEYGNFKLIRSGSLNVDSGLTMVSYILETPFGAEYTLGYNPLDSSDGTKYTWNSNPIAPDGADTGLYMSGIEGCGSAKYLTSWDKDAKDSDFIATGKTDTGQTIYTFANPDNSILKYYYSAYQEKFGYSGAKNLKNLSLQDFNNIHGVIAYKNSLNQYLIYNREDLTVAGGCGKPVIYLYPTKTENVSVKVGAKIEKSEPKYNPETGWKVLANPNGQLTINNEKYNSLFWEGLGNGFYPNVTNGTIIKKADAAKTMRDQLKQQGLNQTEINDFMDYWQSKIPNKPYIRLTWFNTAQMNELAPLAISPKPQTLIRVFLDMKGLDKKISIPTQKLTSIPRQGFTAIEWGGLLRGGIK